MAEYSRREQYLAIIAGGSGSVPDPGTREEYFLAKIAGADVALPEPPYTQYETYLAKLAGADVSVPQPVTQLDKFLYAACGYDVTLPVPVTREEILWEAILNAGGLRITGQPEDVTVAAGQQATFSVTADGGEEPYAYRWQYLRPGTTAWTNISSGGRSQSYTLTTETRHSGNLYRCQVTDDAGEIVYSETALLTVTES